MKLKNYLIFTLLLCATCVTAQSIKSSKLRKHIEILAADSLDGRKYGTIGLQHARNYIVETLKDYGFTPVIQNIDTTIINRKYAKTYMGIQKEGVFNIQNIYFTVEGTDPELSKEWIIIAAHYDGQGAGSKGANDNIASVSALLETSKTMPATKRSILYLFTDCEELGLFGASAFLKNAPIDPSQIKLMINNEMLGRKKQSESTLCVGVGFIKELDEIFKLLDKKEYEGISTMPVENFYLLHCDCRVFLQAEIPSICWLTDDISTLHNEKDTIESIDIKGLKTVTKAIKESLIKIANYPTLTKNGLEEYRINIPQAMEKH